MNIFALFLALVQYFSSLSIIIIIFYRKQSFIPSFYGKLVIFESKQNTTIKKSPFFVFSFFFFLRNRYKTKQNNPPKHRKASCLMWYPWPQIKILDLSLKEGFFSAPQCLWPKNIFASFITAVGLSLATGLNKWKAHYCYTPISEPDEKQNNWPINVIISLILYIYPYIKCVFRVHIWQ